MPTFREILREQMALARQKHLPKDESAVSGFQMVSLFVGEALAMTVAFYLYIGLIGPSILDMTNASANATYVGAGASGLVSAITLMYFLGVFVLPIVVVMTMLKE